MLWRHPRVLCDHDHGPNDVRADTGHDHYIITNSTAHARTHGRMR